MIDRFGVPGNMFGPLSDDFFGLLGRVVAVGAMLEMQIAAAVMRIENTNEEAIAGCQVGRLFERFDVVARDRESAGDPLSQDLIEMRYEAQKVMGRRNSLVHSVWPSSTRGWRTVSKRQREDRDKYVAWTDTSEDDMRELICKLVELSLRFRDA